MSEGRYLYCIVPGEHNVALGPVGIENSDVYSISRGDLSVIVHDCEAKPYDSRDETVVGKWVLSHNKVIEQAMERFGTVLPFRFNTIIQAHNEQKVHEQVRKWLTDDHESLREKLDRVKGKAEYGVQISWDVENISNDIMGADTEIQSLAKEIEKMPEGLAYMNRQKLENLLRRRLENKADDCFRRYFAAVRECVDDVKIEKARREIEGKQMIMNLSCLASDGAKALAEELGKIEELEGFSVHFTGPWPPYSFAEG